ncbi:hypothetical protein MKX01_000419 [Papaver californicum]|nr:hypothetical protein MKX01_000419 [Papaver californicum]
MCSSSSSSQLLLQSSKNRAFSSSRAALLSTKKPVFVSFYQKRNYNVDISHSISLQFKDVISFQSKMVRVKFQLIKMCLFGQEFLMFGNDPIFGDVPIDKAFQFKFILKDPTGEVKWQPGPNRVFQTWETNKTIVVFEDWDIVGLQMISEEEPLANSNTSEDVIACHSNPDDSMPNSCTMEPLANSNTKEPVVACPIKEQTEAGDDVTSTGSFATEIKSASLRDEATLFESVAEPVHVPRSVALPITTAKEGVSPAVKSSNNVKTESKIDVSDVEVATEDDSKFGVGDEKDCQSTNAESTEVLDVLSEEDAELMELAKRNFHRPAFTSFAGHGHKYWQVLVWSCFCA